MTILRAMLATTVCAVLLMSTGVSAATAGSEADIRSVSVKHTKKAVRITLVPHHKDLNFSSTYIEIDTTKKRKGPEFRFVLTVDDWAVQPVRNGKPVYDPKWNNPIDEDLDNCLTRNVRLNGFADFTIKKTKGCLGKPSKIRIRAELSTYTDDYSSTISDHLPSKKRFTAWVKAGKTRTFKG